jgi:hypothetical protein
VFLAILALPMVFFDGQKLHITPPKNTKKRDVFNHYFHQA